MLAALSLDRPATRCRRRSPVGSAGGWRWRHASCGRGGCWCWTSRSSASTRAGREWLAEQLLREKAAGAAVIMASHDAELVDAVADVRLPSANDRRYRRDDEHDHGEA